MRYVAFHVRPFRAFNRFNYLSGDLPLDGLTVVLGGNSSGKTTLLEMLYDAVTNESQAADPLRRILRRHDMSYPTLTVELDLQHGPDLATLRRLEPEGEHGDATIDALMERLGLEDPIDAMAQGLLEAHMEDARLHGASPPHPPVEYFWQLVAAGTYELEQGDEGDAWLRPLHAADSPYPQAYVPQLAYIASDEREVVLPPVVTAPAEELEPALLTQLLIESLVRRWFSPYELAVEHDDAAMPPTHPWVDDDGHLQPGLVQLASMLEHEVARTLPIFVSQEGDFSLRLLEPGRWASGLRVVAGFETNGEFRRAESVGSGSRRWLAVCLRLAELRLRQYRISWSRGADTRWETDTRFGPSALGEGFDESAVARDAHPPLLLVDEPELHLHPDAQQAVAGWMERRIIDGDISGAVVASHSPSFLEGAGPDTKVVVLRRQPGQTDLVAADDLATFDTLSFEAGLGRNAWFFATNGVLLVEGQHDLEILQTFFASRLDRLRVRLLPLRGTKNTQRLVDSEFLGAAGLPLFVLFDNVRLDRVSEAAGPEGLTDEERVVWSVRRQARRDDIQFLPYDEPDILAALPVSTVERRYGTTARQRLLADGEYWDGEIHEWRRQTAHGSARVSFKRWIAEERLGLSRGTDLVRELLQVIEPGDEPSPALRYAITSLEEKLADNRANSL